ncbi:hypothetical protein GHT09_002832 [Marmota monax]|uniref:Uncharacterized protein n=1 Tax=Marmota monax TaxID=9995 RepID=A0A834PV64_MARMO|nr:hypothetical protein GHT09_002832 [Marmota monax]
MTLFSLLVFFFQMEKHPILQRGPQAGTLHLKLLLVGFRGRCAPGRANQCQGGWDWSDAKIRGQQQCLADRAGRQNRSPPVTRPHTPLVGTMPFFKCVLFHRYTHFLILQCDLITPKQILKESFAFSEMMDMFSLYSETAECEAGSQRDALYSSQ